MEYKARVENAKEIVEQLKSVSFYELLYNYRSVEVERDPEVVKEVVDRS